MLPISDEDQNSVLPILWRNDVLHPDNAEPHVHQLDMCLVHSCKHAKSRRRSKGFVGT